MIRSLCALLLFATVFLSYGVQWVVWRASGRKWLVKRWEVLHVRNAKRLVRGFLRLRGIYIKLGQVISVLGTFLPEVYSDVLKRLQDAVPPRPARELTPRLERVWGPEGANRLAHFEPQALAAASLAQVHRGTTKDGRDVAIKVLYPDIEKLIERDLFVIRLVVPIAYRIFGFRRMERVVQQLETMLRHEIDYDHERSNIERFHEMFGDRRNVVVPRVVDELSGPGVLVMSFEEGVKLTDRGALESRGIDPEAIARTLVDCYLSMLFEHRVFHADPHPGNFLAREGNLLVILDYGAVEPISENLVRGIQTVIVGGLTRNADVVLKGVEQMGFVSETGDKQLLERIGREYLRSLGQLQIKDFAHIDPDTVVKMSGILQLRGQLRKVAASVVYPEGYFYVERALVLLFGLVGKLAPELGLLGVAAPFASKAVLRGFRKSPSRDEAKIQNVKAVDEPRR